MSGGPDDIRAKVDARKAELRQQAHAEGEQARADSEKKKDAAKRAASDKLAQLETAAAARKAHAMPAGKTVGRPVSREMDSTSGSEITSEPVDIQLIETELDDLISKKAQNRWTGGENAMFLLTLLGGFVLLFVAWPLGLFSIGFSFLYLNAKQRRYRGIVRQELGLPSMLDAK
jgi:hypothetical protein